LIVLVSDPHTSTICMLGVKSNINTQIACLSGVHSTALSRFHHKLRCNTEGGGGSAVLLLGGVALHATVIEPAGAVFSAVEVNLQPPYNPSVGVSKLIVALPTQGRGAIVVSLSVSSTAATVTPNRLSQWGESGPFAVGE
jgi:hypothetical protein